MNDEICVEENGHVQRLVDMINERLKGWPELDDVNFVLLVNDNEQYAKFTRGLRVKPVGPDNMMTKMLNQYCPRGCGCRLKTDGNMVWCSGTFCDFIGKEETF